MDSAHLSGDQLKKLHEGEDVLITTDAGDEVELPAEVVEPHLVAIDSGLSRLVRTAGRVISVARRD